MSEEDDKEAIDFTYGDDERYITGKGRVDLVRAEENDNNEFKSNKFTPACHKCNQTNIFMVQCANEEGNSCMTCIGCIFNMIIEVGVKKFCDDNKEFEGMLFSYKDKFKT